MEIQGFVVYITCLVLEATQESAQPLNADELNSERYFNHHSPLTQNKSNEQKEEIPSPCSRKELEE